MTRFCNWFLRGVLYILENSSPPGADVILGRKYEKVKKKKEENMKKKGEKTEKKGKT
jgi:hypothetical protein